MRACEVATASEQRPAVGGEEEKRFCFFGTKKRQIGPHWQNKADTVGFCGVSSQDTGFSSILVVAAIIFVPLLFPHSDAIKRYRFTWAIAGAKYTRVAQSTHKTPQMALQSRR
jgi:hypothetical protein